MDKKILIKVNKDSDLKCPCNGYILGIDKFSYLFEKTFNFDEIKEIVNNTKKEIFISFNRLIFNSELDEYKALLKKIDSLNVKGIIIGDLAAYNYNLKNDLILDQMHLNNSYLSIKHYEKSGFKGIFLTNDITKEEINTIRSNTNIKLFKQAFGYPHLSTSNRSLISNYLDYFEINKDIKKGFIKENNSLNYYPIIEEKNASHILGNKVLNLLEEYDLINVDYFVIDSYLLGDISMVADFFINKKIDKSNLIDKEYNSDNGFINKKTIYKVKNHEK